MSLGKKAFGIACLGTCFVLSAVAALAQETTAKGVNPKDNISKTEVIYRYDFLDLGDYTQSLTFKFDRAFDAQWGGNIELPIVAFKGFGLDEVGLGDVQARVRYSTQAGTGTLVLGAEVVLPTASDDSLGRGKYQLNPAVGYVVPLTQTSFLYMGYKHYFSIAGDDARTDINESQPRLIAGYTSPAGWWLLGDVKYTKSWETEAEQLDFEVEYGRMIGPSTGIWARIGTSALDSDRDAMLLLGVRFIR
jgi:hypothetical protein